MRWKVANDEIKFELLGRIGDDVYMGFGVSGSTDRAYMLGADPVVADFFNGQPLARDFYLSDRAQCSTNNGACPGDGQFSNYVNAASVSGKRNGELSLVWYSHPAAPADVGSQLRGFAVVR